MSEARAPTEERDQDTFHQHLARATPMGDPTPALLDLIRTHVMDPAILDEHPPFVVGMQASNVSEDAYATVMDRSTLDNFAADATAGVAFMNSHRTGSMMGGGAELPMGRTIEGKVVGASSTGPTRLDVTSYLLRGMNLTGLATDEFINGLRSGIARDVSVGFYGGEYRCSICQKDMRRDYTCFHYPGLTYPKLDSKGQPIEGETVRATARIVGAHLSEVSAVYDGATPGCMVMKARHMVTEGQIRGDTIDLLEQRYRMTLPRPARSFPVVDIQPPKEAPVDLTPEELATIRLALTETGAAPDASVSTTVRAIVDDLKTARASIAAANEQIERLLPFEAEVSRLAPLADEGRQYRADLVEAAVTEGKRALGDSFAEETYRGLLTSVPIETVKRMRDDWKAVGDKQFPGGRATIEGHETEAAHQNGAVPSAAFAG